MKVKVVIVAIAIPWLAYALGCEAVAGIEERKFDDAGAGGQGNDTDASTEPEPPSELCEEYCETVLEGCSGEFAVYTGLATCYGVCALLDEGDELEPFGNNVQCRLAQAKDAIASREPQAHCEAAGPGGDDLCGPNCESYCHLFEEACPEEFEAVENCEAKCEGLRDVNRLDVVIDHDGDSLQCRLVHISSATVDPEEHCNHSLFAPLDWCLDSPQDTPACEEYCDLIDVACTGDLKQYETRDQCLAICEVLDRGEIQHTIENTVGCRKYHTYSSLAVPQTHCFHAGPLGDGHCGLDADGFKANCESYCQLLEGACSSDFDDAFSDREECQDACAGEPDDFLAAADTLYAVEAETTEGDTLHCRVLHLARAFEDDSECAAALGGAPCN